MADEQKSIGAILKADPYADKNPFAFKQVEHEGKLQRALIPPDANFPEGQVLRWVNPTYRNQRGLRGHVMMEWDDPYIKGKTQAETRQNLQKYVVDPPDKMAHSEDNYVRRGDSVLARLDKAIFDSRQLQRALKSNRNARVAAESEKNAALFGEGMTDDRPTRRQITPRQGE